LAVIGGLVVSQVLTLYITPVIYLYLERFHLRFTRTRKSGRPEGTAMPEPEVVA
jgi:HAE1 family hydrophobic/amphiphilic exporter-1